ncbi:TetR/AcrR family transcriptional regulator [Leucobacter celer]|uniref:TetR/AcrR family transcriptional regulator n=1 Tax=Leucobacter celer TaxID=668625 RepID=UPI0006A76554|nr:TetR/AcrR family transcriptional regulator [Leucobacter celer]
MDEAEVSRTLALAWGLAAAPQRGPKRELTLERIVDAAIGIADAEGLAAVTMQRVAQAFEFSTMALYRYVATKDELYRLMLDAALGAEPLTVDAEDWRAEMRAFLGELLGMYRRHPWVLDIPLSPDIHLMPGQLRAADLGLRAMRGFPAPAQTKLAVLILLSAFARGHAAVEREVLAGSEMNAATRALIEEAVTPALFPHVAPLVRNGSYFGDDPSGGGAGPARPSVPSAEPVQEDADAILEFSTDVLLTGLEATLAGMPEQPEGAPPVPELSPQEIYEAAEAELRAHVELRKRTQQRVRELERQEAALHKARDRAKELAKAHARHLRSQAEG